MNRSQRFAAAAAIAAAFMVAFAPDNAAAATATAAKGPNVDPAKRGSSPRTEAVAQAALARHADRTRDVLSMNEYRLWSN